MTEYIQALWLAVLQGITEFLPISSSGHLILIPKLLGWPDQGLAFDVAVHVGSLAAVLVYFYRDIRLIVGDWFGSISGGPSTPYSRLAWSIGCATIMIGLVGLFAEDLINRWLRQPLPVAMATIVFGLLLWWADRAGTRARNIEQIGWLDVLAIGSAQVFALIPGTSRSGVTITAGLALGLTREASARFSFLMAIPVIVLVGVWQARKLMITADPVNWGVLVFATLVSALVAFACIHWFLGYIRRFSMLPFVIYRLFLGLILLWVFM